MLKQLAPIDTRDIEWYLDRLENVRSTSSGYSARCPAHDDRKNSLGIAVSERGEVLFNCLAGCEFEQVMGAFEARDKLPKVTIRHSTPVTITGKPAEWWEGYTGIPVTSWAEWGVKFGEKTIEFVWHDSRVRKVRKAGTKDIFWEGNPAPPFWPDVPAVLPPRIFITEGESDFGVLAYLGYPTWAITKGADSNPAGVWTALHDRGVREVILAFDDDKAGRTGAQRLAGEIFGADIEAFVLEIGSEVNSLMGEKDIRDIWRRIGDEERMCEIVDRLTSRAVAKKRRATKVTVSELLAMPVSPDNWLVKDVWLRSNVGMIVGAPKMGKSFLTLDMGVSIATGTPFLGTFDIPRAGPVVIIGKEDTDAALQDRLQKILIAKGFGGVSQFPHVKYPSRKSEIPLFFDLGRDYILDAPHTEELLQWLYRIGDVYGEIGLVVVDPVLKSLPIGIDEYRATEIGSSVFSSAMRIQQATGAGVCLVHHRGKGGGDGKNFLGSVMFFAAAETSLFLQGDGPDEEGFIGVQGVYKSAADKFWRYRFDDLDQEYRVTVDQTASQGVTIVKTKKLEEEIWNLMMMDNMGLRVTQLCEAFKTSDSIIRRILKTLEESGRARRGKSSVGSATGGPKQDIWFAVSA